MLELKPGWLQRQFDEVSRDIATWPEWMRREAGFLGGCDALIVTPQDSLEALLNQAVARQGHKWTRAEITRLAKEMAEFTD